MYLIIFGLLLSFDLAYIVYAFTQINDPQEYVKFNIHTGSYITLGLTGLLLVWVSIIFTRFTYISKRMYNEIYVSYRCRWTFIVGITLCSLAMVASVRFV